MNNTIVPLIIAVDFDGTLVEAAFPKVGAPNPEAAHYLREFRKSGHRLILWTCRTGPHLAEAGRWLQKVGLLDLFEDVNRNPDDQTLFFENDPRKIGADLYIDDKDPHSVVAGRVCWDVVAAAVAALECGRRSLTTMANAGDA